MVAEQTPKILQNTAQMRDHSIEIVEKANLNHTVMIVLEEDAFQNNKNSKVLFIDMDSTFFMLIKMLYS